jgi:hypothetical protein
VKPYKDNQLDLHKGGLLPLLILTSPFDRVNLASDLIKVIHRGAITLKYSKASSELPTLGINTVAAWVNVLAARFNALATRIDIVRAKVDAATKGLAMKAGIEHHAF